MTDEDENRHISFKCFCLEKRAMFKVAFFWQIFKVASFWQIFKVALQSKMQSTFHFFEISTTCRHFWVSTNATSTKSLTVMGGKRLVHS